MRDKYVSSLAGIRLFKELLTHHPSLNMACPFLSFCFYSQGIFTISHTSPWLITADTDCNQPAIHTSAYYQASALWLFVLFTRPVVTFLCGDLVNPTPSSGSSQMSSSQYSFSNKLCSLFYVPKTLGSCLDYRTYNIWIFQLFMCWYLPST